MHDASNSPALTQLDCAARHFLLTVCLEDADIEALGYWDGEERAGLRPATWCRGYLATLCAKDDEPARRVADLLDLRHLEAVLSARETCPGRLGRACHHAARGEYGGDLAGLLWAVLTDRRPAVYAAGHRLMNELCVVALRGLVA